MKFQNARKFIFLIAVSLASPLVTPSSAARAAMGGLCGSFNEDRAATPDPAASNQPSKIVEWEIPPEIQEQIAANFDSNVPIFEKWNNYMQIMINYRISKLNFFQRWLVAKPLADLLPQDSYFARIWKWSGLFGNTYNFWLNRAFLNKEAMKASHFPEATIWQAFRQAQNVIYRNSRASALTLALTYMTERFMLFRTPLTVFLTKKADARAFGWDWEFFSQIPEDLRKELIAQYSSLEPLVQAIHAQFKLVTLENVFEHERMMRVLSQLGDGLDLARRFEALGESAILDYQFRMDLIRAMYWRSTYSTRDGATALHDLNQEDNLFFARLEPSVKRDLLETLSNLASQFNDAPVDPSDLQSTIGDEERIKLIRTKLARDFGREAPTATKIYHFFVESLRNAHLSKVDYVTKMKRDHSLGWIDYFTRHYIPLTFILPLAQTSYWLATGNVPITAPDLIILTKLFRFLSGLM